MGAGTIKIVSLFCLAGTHLLFMAGIFAHMPDEKRLPWIIANLFLFTFNTIVSGYAIDLGMETHFKKPDFSELFKNKKW